MPAPTTITTNTSQVRVSAPSAIRHKEVLLRVGRRTPRGRWMGVLLTNGETTDLAAGLVDHLPREHQIDVARHIIRSQSIPADQQDDGAYFYRIVGSPAIVTAVQPGGVMVACPDAQYEHHRLCQAQVTHGPVGEGTVGELRYVSDAPNAAWLTFVPYPETYDVAATDDDQGREPVGFVDGAGI